MPLEEGELYHPTIFSTPPNISSSCVFFSPLSPNRCPSPLLFSFQLPSQASIPFDAVPILSNWLQYSFSPKICSSTPIRSQHHQNVSGQQALHHGRRPQGQARPYSRMYSLFLEAIPLDNWAHQCTDRLRAIKVEGLCLLFPESPDDYLGYRCGGSGTPVQYCIGAVGVPCTQATANLAVVIV